MCVSVKSVYEEPLADILQQLVAEFAKFMKQQRDFGDEINRHNDSMIKKVRLEIDTHCQVGCHGDALEATLMCAHMHTHTF